MTPWVVWQCTYAQASRPLSQWLYNYGLYGAADHEQRLDYSFWALIGPDHAMVIDTGCSSEVASRRHLTWFSEPGELLRQVGVEPASIEDVVLTHLHYDHAGSLGSFPAAQVHCHLEDFEFWRGVGGTYPQCCASIEARDIADLEALFAEGRLHLLDSERTELAPGVEVVRVGGHSPGQLVVKVTTVTGPLVIASDAAHLRVQIQRNWPFGVLVDLPGAYQALETVRRLAEGDLRRIIPGHEPTVRAGDAKAPSSTPSYVTRLA